MKKLIVILPTIFIVACGGGGSESAPAPATAAVSPAPATTSTALKNNTVASTTKFEQFDAYLTQIPDRTARFSSQIIYIKLYTSDGNTLYLGRYFPEIRLALHVPNHVTSVKIDIFSTDPSDPQITEDITL